MRKILTVLMIALLLFFFVGCGAKDVEPGEQGAQGAAETGQTQPLETQKDKGGEPAKEAQTEPSEQNGSFSVSAAADKSVELPKDYPKDKFPIYKDSYIFMVNELEGGYVLTAFSKDSVDKVMDFYKELLAEGDVFMETKTGESFTSFGSKDGYVYNLDVGGSSEIKDYQTSITIVLQPE